MKKMICLFCFFVCFVMTSFAQPCLNGSEELEISLSSVRNKISTDGSLSKTGGGINVIDVLGEEISTVFAFGPWMKGTDRSGQVHGAYSEYSLRGADFFPGPIVNGGIDSSSCENWDHIFSVSKTNIDKLINDWEDNGSIDQPVDREILAWPAIGNPYFFDELGFNLPNQELAPFIDRNQDGIYDPLNGDYPDIQGSVFHWWILNDIGNIVHKESELIPLGVELTVSMWYDYNAPTPSFFYEITVTNKSSLNYSDFFLSLWMDGDLGCPDDDYIGCIPEKDLVFIYNVDPVDGISGSNCPLGGYNHRTFGSAIPMLGIKTLDLRIDGSPETTKMDYVQVIPREGTSSRIVIPYENLGFDFPGSPDDPGGQSMCAQGEPAFQDLRVLWGIGPRSFSPEQQISKRFVIYLTDIINDYPCPSADVLIDLGNELEELDNTTSSILESTILTKLEVYPNPVLNQSINISAPWKTEKVWVTDLIGNKIELTKILNNKYSIENLTKGMYILCAQSDRGNYLQTKIIVQ